MSVYAVTVPFTGKWLTANPRSTADRYGRSRAVKEWRAFTVLACQAAKAPKGIGPVTIHAVCYHVGRSPVRDKLNLAPTIKAIVDGLTPQRTWIRLGKPQVSPGYGLLADDSDKHVHATTWDLVPTFLQPYVLLTITEVS